MCQNQRKMSVIVSILLLCNVWFIILVYIEFCAVQPESAKIGKYRPSRDDMHNIFDTVYCHKKPHCNLHYLAVNSKLKKLPICHFC